MALEHVPTDAVSPAFGKLLLEVIPTRNLRADMSKRIALPADADGDIDFLALSDEAIPTVLVMSMAQNSIGWYQPFDDGEEDFANSVAFLTGLGVVDPRTVIQAAERAFEIASKKPKRPRKPMAKKAAKKTSASAKATKQKPA